MTEQPGDSLPRPHYPVEPWQVREPSLDLAVLAQTESVFALSNGHIGLRGNLDEGEPNGIPGTYLNSFYETRPLPYAEAGYGYPEDGQTVVNCTNGKILRLLVGDEPFDVRYGDLQAHERTLDLRAGVLRRTAEWVSPAGVGVRIRSARLVSFTQRSVAAICYEVEPLDAPVRVILQSELVANEEVPAQSGDPRVAASLGAPLEAQHQVRYDTGAVLIHRTKVSGQLMAASMQHEVTGPDQMGFSTDVFPDWARTTVGATLESDESLRVVKFLGYGWSSQRSLPALRDQVAAALTGARHSGWEGLLAEQRDYLDRFWDAADVEVDGDAEVQQAVRFALFHVLQAGARAERRSIPAKGLTGPGYDGHAFWDTEAYVLPVLTATQPQAAGDALRWRQSTLDLARERASILNLQGAVFPWRTIRGQECSAYWPAGTAAFHLGADIAAAAVRHVQWTGDEAFERDVAFELLVETARMWRSLGHHDVRGHFHVDGVTGPDEYTAVMDDNVFTNVMAQANLLAAADAAARHLDRARAFGVGEEEAASWRDAGLAMTVLWDADLGVHPQSQGFTRYQEWDFAHTPADQYPLLLHRPYVEIYRKQVVKQADLVLALHWRGDAFTPQEKAADFAYYERLTVRDSSLSACTQAVVAAEVGHLELAHDYLGEAALLDLHDIYHNTRDGVHIASLAGAWLALVAGFGGMRDHGGQLSFRPRLPESMPGLRFNLLWRGCRLRVEIDGRTVTYSLRDGEGEATLTLLNDGNPVTISAGAPVTLPLAPVVALTPRPQQPFGREPRKRGMH